MRSTSALLAGALAVLASAQPSASSVTAPSTTTAAAADPAQASMIACIDACRDGDVDCTSKCIAVPNPSASQVNQTNECVAKCPQGDGSKAGNEAYGKCVDGCIAYYYFTSGRTPQATGTAAAGSGSSAAAATATGSAPASGTASRSGSSTASGTASGASSSSTADSAAARRLLRAGPAGLGLLGFLVAFAAL